MEEKRKYIESKPKIVMATVYLKSKTGRSILKEAKFSPIDPTPYTPNLETIQKAIFELEKRGFKVEAQGITLSISGPPELFEEVCGIKVFYEERIKNKLEKIKEGAKLIYQGSKPLIRIKGLEDIIEGIAFAIPGVSFKSKTE